MPIVLRVPRRITPALQTKYIRPDLKRKLGLGSALLTSIEGFNGYPLGQQPDTSVKQPQRFRWPADFQILERAVIPRRVSGPD